MNYVSKRQQYEASALREEDAAASAITKESARIHAALAALYRHEAAKMRSVGRALSVAFGEDAGLDGVSRERAPRRRTGA